ncbi:MAG: NAD(P)/FAD-dependent oxidoreductase [Candidatus Izemoplasmatales bacterium]
MFYEAIIIGGGPAGLMAANVFSQEKVNYLLLEKNDQVGKKLLMTGGGRSNVTNNLSVPAFIDELDFKHKKFLYSTLSSFGPHDVLTFFKKKGLNLILEPPIKYFPETGKASSILDALTRDINKSKIKLKEHVIDVRKENQYFHIKTKENEYLSKYLIIATGSKSFPETGSNGDGLIFANQFNIASKEFTPAETSVYGFSNQLPFKQLKGAKLSNVRLFINGKKSIFQDDMIFTHFGLSGPVIFHASHQIFNHLQKGNTKVSFSLCGLDYNALNQYFINLDKEAKQVKTILSKLIPNQLATYIESRINYGHKPFRDLTKEERINLVEILTNFEVNINHVEDIQRAYVNAGGIDTLALNPKSFESKTIEHLYFVGETVDIFGPIGGFNITMALSSGHTAANHIYHQLNHK